MKVKDLVMLYVEGKIVIKDNNCDTICEVVRANSDWYEILEENEVLDDEISYFKIANNKLYIILV